MMNDDTTDRDPSAQGSSAVPGDRPHTQSPRCMICGRALSSATTGVCVCPFIFGDREDVSATTLSSLGHIRQYRWKPALKRWVLQVSN